ncbi:MAG TPA: hypothetical protein VG474_05520 [Solirubrobacteraceae bacterium]|nr:hypothetical protein [Solirubrobacteraceae bacterium]
MQDEQVEGQAESGEQTADEAPAETEGAAADSGDSEMASAVDEQAAQSSGTSAESEPEVPDDARETIERAQQHIDNLNMDQEREASKRAT